MQEVELVFRGFDAHELACHFVARQAGIYARHGLRVRLRDGIGAASESSGLPQFHAACGLALGDWLRGARCEVHGAGSLLKPLQLLQPF